MANEIADIEQRRYIELEKQRAAMGMQTAPQILMEIAELRQKYGPVETLGSNGTIRPNERRRKLDGDVDLLISMVGSITNRLTETEHAIRVIGLSIYAVGAIAGVALIGVLLYVAHAI